MKKQSSRDLNCLFSIIDENTYEVLMAFKFFTNFSSKTYMVHTLSVRYSTEKIMQNLMSFKPILKFMSYRRHRNIKVRYQRHFEAFMDDRFITTARYTMAQN